MTDETKKGKILLGFRKPEVDPTNPWQDDLLGRQEIAQRITTIVTSVATTVDQNLQLSLNGPWGSGKTWMLQRLQKHLENQGLRAIYYNTWEDDFCQDPLMGILGQLHLKLRNYSSYRQTLKELEKTARRIAAAAGLSATRHIGLDMGQVIRAINHDPLKQYKRERESLEKLRGLLKDIGRHTMELTQNPLVLILDELDRCRPEYAVKCLERIKHLMEVPGIVFLLGINRDQLCEAIQHANGIRDPSMIPATLLRPGVQHTQRQPGTFLPDEDGRTGNHQRHGERNPGG